MDGVGYQWGQCGCSSPSTKVLHGCLRIDLLNEPNKSHYLVGPGSRTFFGHSRLVIFKRDMQKCAHSFKRRDGRD